MNPMKFRVSLSLVILIYLNDYYNNSNVIHLTIMPLSLQRLKIPLNLGFTKKYSKRRNDMELMDEKLGIEGEYLRMI